MTARSPWRIVRPYLPRGAIAAACLGHREYIRLRCRYQARLERSELRARGQSEVPAPFLRYRVDGSTDLEHFLTIGKRIVDDMEAALASIGRELSSFGTILDFGCGCGRVLRWLAGRISACGELWGTDIDADAIAWCRTHLGAGAERFLINAGRPPLDAHAESFDLVYAISVFSHLREDYQRSWLQELERVTRSGGIVLLTIHGPSCVERLGPELQERLHTTGFLFHEADSARALFPQWYRASYQTRDYLRSAVKGSFRVLDQIPRGLVNYQDIVLLEKIAGSVAREARPAPRRAG